MNEGTRKRRNENVNDVNDMLEFQRIKEWLMEASYSQKARERFERLEPMLDQAKANAAIAETTEARKILDSQGNPPFGDTDGIRQLAREAELGSLLSAEELDRIRQFAVLCARMSRYLEKCAQLAPGIAGYGQGIQSLSELQDEIERCIRGGRVDDYASKTLHSIRQKEEQTQAQIRMKLENLLRSSKACFSENFVSMRNGHYTLPVKKEYKNKVPGSVIDTSSTGATLFIEPDAASKLREELERLKLEEENEERIILYTLSAMVGEESAHISMNLDYMEELDYIFSKGKLSARMDGIAPSLNTDRRIYIRNGRHPLLEKEKTVPLNISFGENIRGVIITGPNTGGKTVAIKTVGLLSVMAQCGLHVPCEEADLAMNAEVFCDIRDGQSISENLSTFSSHIKNVIRILERADEESLVLMDELGSGTDPAEGMGIAVAVLEELRRRGCLFLVTTHYPEVKEYAQRQEGVINARMAFDKESLRPLYRLELGESGESCAFYIAQRLGMSKELLERARRAAYQDKKPERGKRQQPLHNSTEGKMAFPKEKTLPRKKENPSSSAKNPSRIRRAEEMGEKKRKQEEIANKFSMGDSVMVYPEKKLGIVFASANERGEVGVQIQKKKSYVSYKRLKLQVAAKEMYPPDYDFSIIFDTVENRKARHAMERKHVPGLEIRQDGPV